MSNGGFVSPLRPTQSRYCRRHCRPASLEVPASLLQLNRALEDLMAYKILEFPGRPDRILALEADTPDELEELISRALKKDWQEFARGVEPATGRRAVWMKKPADALVPTP